MPWCPGRPVKPPTPSSHILPYLANRKLPSENVNEFFRLALLINHILHANQCSYDEQEKTNRRGTVPPRKLANFLVLLLPKVTLLSLPAPYLGSYKPALAGLGTMHDDKDLGVVKDIRVTLNGDNTRVYDRHHLDRDGVQVRIRHELNRSLHLQQRRNV